VRIDCDREKDEEKQLLRYAQDDKRWKRVLLGRAKGRLPTRIPISCADAPSKSRSFATLWMTSMKKRSQIAKNMLLDEA
jgi:hypothetical protein